MACFSFSSHPGSSASMIVMSTSTSIVDSFMTSFIIGTDAVTMLLDDLITEPSQSITRSNIYDW